MIISRLELEYSSIAGEVDAETGDMTLSLEDADGDTHSVAYNRGSSDGWSRFAYVLITEQGWRRKIATPGRVFGRARDGSGER